MTELLTRLFIRDKDNVQDPAVRQRYGALSGFTGICLNILLFLGKLIAGTVSGSIAITADAFNNLSALHHAGLHFGHGLDVSL